MGVGVPICRINITDILRPIRNKEVERVVGRNQKTAIGRCATQNRATNAVTNLILREAHLAEKADAVIHVIVNLREDLQTLFFGNDATLVNEIIAARRPAQNTTGSGTIGVSQSVADADCIAVGIGASALKLTWRTCA